MKLTLNWKPALICFLLGVPIGVVYSQEIGLQLYSLREQFKSDVPGTLAKIKNWNITEIEGGDTYGMKPEAFKALLAKNNLKTVSIGADLQQLSDNPQRVADNAKAVGAKYVVCFWIPHQGNDFSVEDIRKGAAIFNSAGKILSENGLSLCYHPHGYEFRPYDKGTLFDYLASITDSKYFNFEIDVYWIKHPGQDPVALLKKYPGRFLLMHLKDRRPGTEGNQNGNADPESNVILGQGDVGIAEIMREAKKAGIRHYFIEDESSRSEQQIPESLAFLKQLKN